MPSFVNQQNSFAQLSTPPYDRHHYFESMLYYTPWQTVVPRDDCYAQNGTYTERQPTYKPNPSAPLFQPKLHHIASLGMLSDRAQTELGTTLPPIQSYHEMPLSYQPLEPPKPKEEQAAGGLVKVLDYDLQVMVDFLLDSTLATYAPQLLLPRNQLSWSDFLDSYSKNPNPKPVTAEFRDWLRHVLAATRLPSTTIFLALHYLAKRVEDFEGRNLFRHELDVKRMFIVSLIIASKYADDSTFINRSWAEVAKIDIEIINHLELEWLQLIEWRLDVKVNGGWENHRAQFKRFELNRSMRSLTVNTPFARLNPLNTNLPTPSATTTPVRSYAMSAHPAIYEQQTGSAAKRTKLHHEPYSAMSVTRDPWNPPRLISDLSPDSAPYTGPATPEFYAGPTGWAQPAALHAIESGRYASLSGYNAWPQAPITHTQPAYETRSLPSYYNSGSKYDEYNTVWNPSPPAHGHQSLNGCLSCPPGLNLAHGYHTQPVYA